MIGNFKTYLEDQHVVLEKQVGFYVTWVMRFFSYFKKDPGDPVPQEELDTYLNHLSMKLEEWQVKQAKEAIRLYLYFRKRKSAAFSSGQTPLNERWREATGEMQRMLRLKHRSFATEKAYLGWLRDFYRFVKGIDPEALTSEQVRDFLSYLAVERHVTASTQNQAFNAILFFYRHALHKETVQIEGTLRARQSLRLPVVLTKQEVLRLLDNLEGYYRLMARLIYGCGLRISECLRLRIKDIDFEKGCLIIRAGKGDADRVTVLPESLKDDLRKHLEQVRRVYDQDRSDGVDGVFLPGALEKKYPDAGKSWVWFWTFPSRDLSADPRSGKIRRHHIHETGVQRQIKEAARKAGIPKNVTAHSLRHSFATRLLENGYDIRTIQELLGHKNVQTTMIYTHVAAKNVLGVKSPLDL